MLSRVLHQNDLLQCFWNQDNYSSQEMVLVQTGYIVDLNVLYLKNHKGRARVQ